MTTAVVSGVGGPAGRAVAHLLGERGLTVIGVDIKKPSDVRTPGFVRVPPVRHPAFVPTMVNVVRAHEADYFVPTVSEELPVIAEQVHLFQPTRVQISSAESVVTADDKWWTMRLLEGAGVPVPTSSLPSQVGGLSEAVERCGHPFLVKPRVSRGGRGVRVFAGTEVDEWSSLSDAVVVQRFAPGTEYAPLVFVPADGSEPEVVVLEKTALRDGLHGNALGVQVVEGPASADVAALARATVAALGLVGVADIDIRRLADGTPVVLEVNARFGANSVCAPSIVERMLREWGVDPSAPPERVH